MRRLELQEAVDLLPEHYRSAVLMYYLSGLSYREIAELMEVPLSTVCGRLQQGRIRLRQLWDEPDHEEISGGVDIDVGGVQIEATRLRGRVRIYNRFGHTQLHQDQLATDSRIELESCGGDIHLSLKGALLEEVLLDEVHLTVLTLCGRIHSTVFKDRDKPLIIANNSEVMVLSNAPSGPAILAANFMLKSEVGW